MPRKTRPRDTTIYVPPPSSGGSEVAGAAPSLEVLLVAQQIAHQRGHAFDIESFLSPEQRAEYAALQGEDPPTEDTDGDRGGSAGSGSGCGAGSSEEREGTTAEGRCALDGEEGTGTPPPSKRIKLGPNTPLSQVYWKQRLERLARVRSRSATPMKDTPVEPPSPARSREVSPSPWRGRELRDNAHHHHRKPQPPLTPADKAEISSSASYWNHLLIQARAARGPQYDFNTRQLLFDRESEAHYTHGKPPREPTPPPPTPPPPERQPEQEQQDKDKEREGSSKGKEKEAQANGDPPQQRRPQIQPQPNGTPSKSRPPTPQQSQPPQGGPPLQPSPGHNQGTHARLAAAQAAQAQASAQAQALSLGGGPQSPFGDPGMNPGMMQIPQGVNPMALMGGGGPQPGPMLGGGQGPMLGGGWQDN